MKNKKVIATAITCCALLCGCGAQADAPDLNGTSQAKDTATSATAQVTKGSTEAESAKPLEGLALNQSLILNYKEGETPVYEPFDYLHDTVYDSDVAKYMNPALAVDGKTIYLSDGVQGFLDAGAELTSFTEKKTIEEFAAENGAINEDGSLGRVMTMDMQYNILGNEVTDRYKMAQSVYFTISIDPAGAPEGTPWTKIPISGFYSDGTYSPDGGSVPYSFITDGFTVSNGEYYKKAVQDVGLDFNETLYEFHWSTPKDGQDIVYVFNVEIDSDEFNIRKMSYSAERY